MILNSALAVDHQLKPHEILKWEDMKHDSSCIYFQWERLWQSSVIRLFLQCEENPELQLEILIYK